MILQYMYIYKLCFEYKHKAIINREENNKKGYV